MARGRRNDQIQANPDTGIKLEGETFENIIEPTERVQDGLQGQNSTSNNEKMEINYTMSKSNIK